MIDDEFLNFCKIVEIDGVLSLKCLDFIKNNDKNFLDLTYKKLNFDGADYYKVQEELNDPTGLKILAIHLLKAFEAHQKYLKLGISETIYIDTFKCFSRFIKETKIINPNAIFDRFYWTWRQIELKLFRIGELEYEICESEHVISIHIPSDANLNINEVNKSLDNAKLFFNKYFPYTNTFKYVTCTWLINDALKDLLNKESNIIKFKEKFKIIKTFPDDDSFYEWIYQTKNKDINSLKGETSLQKNLKTYLLQNKKFGSSYGILIERE